ncbi:hypothetical protein GWC95_01780 [Sediminibacterium roseum]|uniref:VanZ like family protein n=1 Tax=Sediminibacterium roseum TaxID=1978412 RepID=A0ABW9ZU86_9BACT|nr:VanZ family protein [Sediminibacterium roseum]NCI48635.1 hypothetical protein [Sediminibacterium roseum]
MHLKKISKRAVIAGTLLIWAIKFIVRPFVHVPPAFKPLVGFAPNLVGSFLIPFGACCFFQKFFKLQTNADLNFTCCFGLLLVIINEFVQLVPVFGRTFDLLDILSSVAGVFLGHLVFAMAMRKQWVAEEY